MKMWFCFDKHAAFFCKISTILLFIIEENSHLSNKTVLNFPNLAGSRQFPKWLEKTQHLQTYITCDSGKVLSWFVVFKETGPIIVGCCLWAKLYCVGILHCHWLLHYYIHGFLFQTLADMSKCCLKGKKEYCKMWKCKKTFGNILFFHRSMRYGKQTLPNYTARAWINQRDRVYWQSSSRL